MKNIEFQAVTGPIDPESAVVQQTLYSVHLGNGHTCYFTSDRNAQQFNASAERFLNDGLFRANMLLADVYPAWRMAWYYMDKLQPAVDRAATVAMREAEQAIDRALKRRGGPDYIHYAWRDVQVSLGCVRDLLLIVVDLYRTKGHGVDRQRYEVLLSQVNELADRLRHFGSAQADAPNAVLLRPRP